MAKKAIGTRCSQPMVSARASRSGERYSRRYSPSDALRMTWACFSLGRELFSTAAGIPICASCAAWSCINAINGETTIAVRPSITAGNW